MAANNHANDAARPQDGSFVSLLNDLFNEHARQEEVIQLGASTGAGGADIEAGMDAQQALDPDGTNAAGAVDPATEETAAALARRIRMAGGQIIDLQAAGAWLDRLRPFLLLLGAIFLLHFSLELFQLMWITASLISLNTNMREQLALKGAPQPSKVLATLIQVVWSGWAALFMTNSWWLLGLLRLELLPEARSLLHTLLASALADGLARMLLGCAKLVLVLVYPLARAGMASAGMLAPTAGGALRSAASGGGRGAVAARGGGADAGGGGSLLLPLGAAGGVGGTTLSVRNTTPRTGAGEGGAGAAAAPAGGSGSGGVGTGAGGAAGGAAQANSSGNSSGSSRNPLGPGYVARLDARAVVRQQGLLLAFLEQLGGLYRCVLPIPLWYTYLLHGCTASSIMASLLTGAYVTLKGRDAVTAVQRVWGAVRAAAAGGSPGLMARATQQEVDTTGNCPICHDGVVGGVRLGCGHVFCEECITEWLDRRHTCPMCRVEVRAPEAGAGSDGLTPLLPALF